MAKRDFPCHSCGANLAFEPGAAQLTCPYCGSENAIPQSEEEIHELDFEAALAKGADTGTVERIATGCGSCGAQVALQEGVTADRCPFCDNPIVAQAESRRLIAPKSLLPFSVERKTAEAAFSTWLKGLWFAPSDLARRARTGTIDGVYLPFWTYDCATQSYYRGERGEHYYVTETYTEEENGETVTKTRQVRKTRWYPASGVVFRSFDDVLVCGTQSLPDKLVRNLEPWDLPALVPYDDRYLAGFRTECYRVDLEQGFGDAKEQMVPVIRDDAEDDIGGDEQRIHSLRTQHYNVTFKHILLPLWISAYRYGDKPFRFLVNARTGEVQGERPWSAVKIGLAVVAALMVIAVIVFLVKGR